MAKLKIEQRDIGTIREYENNPRRNNRAVCAVRKSIEKFGFRNPVLLDKDGVILAGHTRVMAAREAGIETVPCITLTHLTQEEQKAFRLVDNRVSEFSEWDKDILAEEMGKITAQDWADFGFSEKQLSELEAPQECVCPRCKKTFIPV